MCKVTYDYLSKGSPVIMRERVSGWCVAEYIAYIDRGGFNWKCYPYKRHAFIKDVPFTKKTIPARDVRVIDNPSAKLPPGREAQEKPKEKVLPTSVQIKLF